MNRDWIPITVQDAVAANAMVLKEFGGRWGDNNRSSLDARLSESRELSAKNEWDLFSTAAQYAWIIVSHEPFPDGNRRTGLICAYVFLGSNGLRLTAPEEQAVLMTLGLADKSVAVEQFAQWLRDNSVRRSGEYE